MTRILLFNWLSQQKGDFALLELPLPASPEAIPRLEAPRMYYSIYHGKKLVNGYSGYSPPLYTKMLKMNIKQGSAALIAPLRGLGIRYLLFHEDGFSPEGRNQILEQISGMGDDLTFTGQWGAVRVYRFRPLRVGPLVVPH